MGYALRMLNPLKLCAVTLLVSVTVFAGAQASQSAPSAVSGPETQTAKAPTESLVPVHPATVEQIHEYFTLTHAIETSRTVMNQMVSGMQANSAPYLPKAFWDDMRTSVGSIDLQAAFIPAYQKYFSEEEMAAVIVFYKSPAGHHMLQLMPFVESAASEQLRHAGQAVGNEVFQRHKDEIEAAKKQYDASHTPAGSTDQPK